MKLNDRGKARHPIKLSIHLFGRPRYAAVLQAKVAAPAATGLDGPRDVQATAQDDPRVVRLLEVEGEPAQTTVQRRHWLDSWWQVEDSALWCLIGHVGQLVASASAGETAARQAAGAARHKRLAAEARLFAEQAHLQAGLDLDVEVTVYSVHSLELTEAHLLAISNHCADDVYRVDDPSRPWNVVLRWHNRLNCRLRELLSHWRHGNTHA